MDYSAPPGYTPPSAPPRRTIQDLRAQILANASLIKPNPNGTTNNSEYHQQLIVAKTPAGGKSAMGTGGKHYAVMMRKSVTKDEIKIGAIGEERDTVEEALEWMLEHTETILHNMIEKHGRVVDDVEKGTRYFTGYAASKWGMAGSSSSG